MPLMLRSETSTEEFWSEVARYYGVKMGADQPHLGMSDDDEDDLLFLDDDEDELEDREDEDAAAPWHVLIVDDDEDVHRTTLFVLGGERILGRPIHFQHAYSGAEAAEVLGRCEGIALVLLDVVMETPDAGLKLVPYIREQLGRTNTRILLRTGQPGTMTEKQVQETADINGYLLKSQLTRNLLLDTVESEIRQYVASAA